MEASGVPHTKRVRVIDVAREAGVSTATISLIMNGKGNFSASTIERVHSVAQRLGYRAHPIARQLRSGKSSAIGLCIRSLDSSIQHRKPGVDHFSRIVGAAATTAVDLGYDLVFFHPSESDPGSLPLWLDGFILEDPTENDPIVTSLCAQQRPLVTIGWDPKRKGLVPHVATNHSRQMTLVLDHLFAGGARHFLMVSGTQRLSWMIQSERAFQRWTRRHDVQGVVIHVDEDIPETQVGTVFEEILKQHQGVDAVLCQNGQHAVAMSATAMALGFRVPEDLQVAAGSDSEGARSCSPSITTIDLQPGLLGQLAVELLVESIANGRPPLSRQTEGKLLVRQSTHTGERAAA